MEVTIEWMDSERIMPIRHSYVLVETPHCKYPFSVAFYDGISWLDADSKTRIMNVQFWAYVQTPAKAHGDGRESMNRVRCDPANMKHRLGKTSKGGTVRDGETT